MKKNSVLLAYIEINDAVLYEDIFTCKPINAKRAIFALNAIASAARVFARNVIELIQQFHFRIPIDLNTFLM